MSFITGGIDYIFFAFSKVFRFKYIKYFTLLHSSEIVDTLNLKL
nr:MAG TPA: hypothetical protein [Caudoviricetes sp.]